MHNFTGCSFNILVVLSNTTCLNCVLFVLIGFNIAILGILAESRAKIWYLYDAFKPPGGLGCCLFLGGGSVVVDYLFIVTPIVGACNCSMFCCSLLYVHSSFAIILMGKKELVSLLNLSSWCLVMVERLLLVVAMGLFVIVDILIILSYYSCLMIGCSWAHRGST